MHRFLIKLEKFYFILDPFWPNSSKQEFSKKGSSKSCNFMQKNSQKSVTDFSWNLKKRFLAQKLQNKIFKQN